ncbi:MAG: hypothetical protein U9Q29_07260 [Campylobacterota bacterium]|nr:hypothetical protein [Campylobacterota bacterium]
MLNEDDYTRLKKSFIESQRLFDKLNRVASQVSELDYDESGLYLDDEEMYKKHWLKLSSKVADALSNSLSGYKIELLNNDNLEIRKLSFNLSKENDTSKIDVDYSEDGAISIIQVS